MTTIDKIRAEIERRRKNWLAASRLVKKGKDTAMYAAGKSSAYTEFLSFLDTLEEPVSEDLEEAAVNAYESWKGGTMDDFIRDMAELGKVLNARKEK